MFNILNLETKALVEDDNGALSFETGVEAAACAKSLAEQTGKRYQPRKAGNCVDWRAREQARIDSGEYTVPQCLLPYLVADHYAHVSKDKPAMLSYTKDDSKGRADLQTRITVRAYLTEFGKDPEASDGFMQPYLVDDLCKEYAEECIPRELLFARTPDEIEAVYTNYDSDCSQVGNSCMRYESSHWESGIHPCRVYGAGDLAIAYLVNDNGETTDRALVWPEKLIYSRVYGETDRLHVLLKNAGYRKSAYYQEPLPTFEGAKLLKLSASDDDDGCFVMPYIDEDVGARLAGKFFIIDKDGSYSTGETEGRTCEPEERTYCERCENSCDETYYVYTRDYWRGGQSWCEHCVENNTFRCDRTGDLYSDDCSSYEIEGVGIYCQYAFATHGGECEHTNTYHRSRDLRDVIVNDKGDTETWCRDAIDEDAWECERTGKLYSNDVQSIAVTIRGIEKIWSQAAVNEFGDECDKPVDAALRLIPAEQLTIAERAQLLTLKSAGYDQRELELAW